MNEIKVFSMDRENVEKECLDWARMLSSDFKPDIVVFIAKSGFLFAKPIAEYFECPLVDISISRPGNSRKDRIKSIIPWIPQGVLFHLLKSKANYNYNDRNNTRLAELNERFYKVDWKAYKNILLVDDSTDTGWSMLKAKEVLREHLSKDSAIKTLSYCVIDMSDSRVKIDYSKYRNTIVITATSRYSKEYKQFISDFNKWKNESPCNSNGVKNE